jgi:hypothetical protein
MGCGRVSVRVVEVCEIPANSLISDRVGRLQPERTNERTNRERLLGQWQ